MRRKFISNISFLLFANLLVKPLWIFGIDRNVQVQAGAVEYGNYFTAMNIAYLLSVLLDFGINNFTNRSVSRNNKRAIEFLKNLLPVKLVLAVIYLAVTLGFAVLSGIHGWLLLLVFLSTLAMTATSFVLHFRAYVAALHKFRTDSYLSVTDKLIAIVLVASFFIFSSSKLPSTLILAFSVSQFLALAVTAVIAYNIIGAHSNEIVPKWNFKYKRLILLHSVPFALLILQMTIYGRIDGFLLNRLLPQGSDETGIYASGFRLLDAATQIGYLAATILLSMFARAIKEKKDVRALANLSGFMLIFGSTALALIISYFKLEVVQILYHTADIRYANVLEILMFAFIPIASNYVFSTLLTANGSLKLLNIFAALGIVINVVLNFIFIPKFSALGAAFSALITQSFIAVCNIAAVFSIFRKTKR